MKNHICIILFASILGAATAQECDTITKNPRCRARPNCVWEAGKCVDGTDPAPPLAPFPAFEGAFGQPVLVCGEVTNQTQCAEDVACEWVQGACETRPGFAAECFRQEKNPDCRNTPGCRWVQGACVNDTPENCVANLEELVSGTLPGYEVQNDTVFNMDIAFEAQPETAAIFANILEKAKRSWERTITSDSLNLYADDVADSVQFIPAAFRCEDNLPGLVDDVNVCVKEGCLDGPLRVLAAGTPTLIRLPGIPMTLTGGTFFDTADLALALQTEGGQNFIESILTHELGHILGIGPFWPFTGLVDFNDGRYVTSASRINVTNVADGNIDFETITFDTSVHDVWSNQWGCVGQVPIDGSSLAGGHWSESCLQTELMTTSTTFNAQDPKSLLTIAALEDFGHIVDFSQANMTYMPRAECCDGSMDFGQLDPTRRLRGGTETAVTKRTARKLAGPQECGELSEDKQQDAENSVGLLIGESGGGPGALAVSYIHAYYADGDCLYEVTIPGSQ